MIMQAIEESKKDAPYDGNNPNPDAMTYEQLLELEEANGKVSKGLTPAQIRALPEKIWRKAGDTMKKEDSCSICFEKYITGDRIKELRKCYHSYHSKCINQWLQNEKRCPVCNDCVI